MIETNKIYQGDALAVLKTWPDACINCVVTSPPYWGLRDYGVKGQLGLEATPQAYIESMAATFSEVRRVLRDDGTLWLNIGDSYNSNSGAMMGKNFRPGSGRADGRIDKRAQRNRDGVHAPDLKAKDLVGIPWMLAFALRADGWYLRQDIIWSKPNPMPESVTDRCTKAHEYIFMLSKSAKYFYDQKAIAEPGALSQIGRQRDDVIGGNKGDKTHHSPGGSYNTKQKQPAGWDAKPGAHKSIHRDGRSKPDKQRGHSRRHDGFNDRWDQMNREEQCSGMINKRSVWTVSPQPFPEAHFATFPEDLIAPCILAGTASQGLVLDPFMGAGTTALVAARLNRRFVGIELNPEYIKIAQKRVANEVAQEKFL